MARYSQIRDNLKTRLDTIAGLNIYDVWPDQINVPCAIIQPADGTYEETFGGANAGSFHRFALQLYVSAAGGLRQGQDNLDPYLSTSSTGGIYGAVNADRTLGGLVWGTFVRGYREYGPAGADDGNPPAYMGVIVDIEVQTS